jgi:CheY-like chemotaxis protein
MAKHHILIIDDESDFLALMRMRLEAAGFSVATALSGQAGLSCLENPRPDVILLDMLMPGSDGLDTYQTIRQNDKTRTLPIIFLTAMAVEGHWEKLAYDPDGPCYVMGKPYDPLLIVQRVREILLPARS